MRTRWIVLMGAVALIGGCDKDKVQKARKAAAQATSRLSQEYREAEVLAHARRLLSAAELRDTQRLKELCLGQGDGDYQAILTCYYNAFAVEDGQGVDAARRYLSDEMAAEGLSPRKAKALEALNEYFRAKGSLRTREVAGLVLVLALEAKYPHAGGRIGKIVAEKLGLMPPAKAASLPTTQAYGPSVDGG